MDTYIISLNNPISLIDQVKNFKLNPILVNGVNGSLLTQKEIRDNASYLYKYIGPKSAIGIALSHIKVWKMLIESNKSNCLVLEDDALFEDNFIEKMKVGLKNTPSDYDILYLGCFGCQNRFNYLSVFHMILNSKIINQHKKINNYVSIPGIALATHGYIVSREGAIKLVKYLDNNIFAHIDYCIQQLHNNKLINEYVLNERIIFQSSTDSAISTNKSNTHPYLLSFSLSHLYSDKYYRSNYDANVSLMQIGPFHGTLSSLLFLIVGIVCAYYKVSMYNITAFYLLLNIPDILYTNNEVPIFIHYFLLTIPSLITNENNVKY